MPAFETPLASPSTWTMSLGSAVLPSTSRYGARQVSTLVAIAPASGGHVLAPATALVRVHAMSGGGAVLELEPQPFAIQTVLAQLGTGLPNFYIGIPAASPTDFTAIAGSLVTIEDTLQTIASAETVWVAIVAQERLTLPMTMWATRIGEALAALALPATTWTDFTTAIIAAVAAEPPVFVLDARGKPLTGVPIDVQVGMSSFSVTLSDADCGDLQSAVVASGRPQLWTSANSANLSIAGGPNSHRWVSVLGGAKADGSITITPTDPHVLFADLDTWFAPQQVQPGEGRVLPRYTYGNQVDFFIDGSAFFRDLVSVARTLRATSNAWMIFSDWGFAQDFGLGPKRIPSASSPQADPDDVHYGHGPTFMELLDELSRDDPAHPPVQVRLLLNRFIQIEDQTALWLGWALLVLLSGIYLGLDDLYHLKALESDGVGLGLLLVALVYIAINIPHNDLRSLETNKPPFDAVNSGPYAGSARAVWSRNPAMKADNPFATEPLPIELETAGALHYGVYHMKSMAMRLGNDLVAWTGGMDIAEGRRDDPRRLAEGPFHDVQARVVGPAATDIANTLVDRWTYDAAHETDIDPANPPTALPALEVPAIAPLSDGTDIAQIARTYPHIVDPARQVDFARNGDFTIHKTLLQSISQAREFIYIEDQYFNPGAEYRQTLLDALANIERLVVIVPTFADQPLGDFRRRDFIQQLKAAAPTKVIIRAPVRRPTLPPVRTRASMGRVILHSILDPVPGLAEEVVLGPDTRLPKPPFWIVIDGESMYATEMMPTLPTDPTGTRRYHVKRGSDAAPGLSPRAHQPGTAAAIVYRTGIYVHAKMMIVDDVFVSIGSANLNRRGFMHDGEGNIFTVPEELRRSSANFARKLRIALWADHLDLPVAIAAPLLHDPIRGSELFLREYERGNRAVDVDLGGFENVVPGLLTMPSSSFALNLLAIFGLSVIPAQDEAIWNTLADPTTGDL